MNPFKKWKIKDGNVDGKRFYAAISQSVRALRGISNIQYCVHQEWPLKINILFLNVLVNGKDSVVGYNDQYDWTFKFDDEEPVKISFTAGTNNEMFTVFSVAPQHTDLVREKLINCKTAVLYLRTRENVSVEIKYSLRKAERAISFVEDEIQKYKIDETSDEAL